MSILIWIQTTLHSDGVSNWNFWNINFEKNMAGNQKVCKITEHLMMPLHLHVNQKSDYDDMMQRVNKCIHG